MDLRCPQCGEPWDHDTLHDEAGARYAQKHDCAYVDDHRAGSNARYELIFKTVSADFRTRGCPAIESYGARCSNERTAHPAIGALYEMLGDDIDGAAAMFDDYSAWLG
jgi:hypothetical protein